MGGGADAGGTLIEGEGSGVELLPGLRGDPARAGVETFGVAMELVSGGLAQTGPGCQVTFDG
jgi:hypothetical protein